MKLYKMEINRIILALISACCVSCHEPPPKFHVDLSPEDQIHYFGKELIEIEDVPKYQYITPQEIDRRKRRDTDSGDTLEYLIDAFGENIHLLLEKNKDLITPGCVVQRYKGNGSREVAHCSTQEVDCFYTGRTSNNSNSWVAATVCGGLHGVIGTGEKTMVIQPIREKHMSRARRETRLENPHIIYEHRPNKRSCDTKGDQTSESATQNLLKRRRRKRSAAKRYIETAVVADKSVYNFHGAETEKVIKTIMNIAAQRFLDPSLGTELYLAVNKIIILEEEEEDLEVNSHSETTLTSLCHWATTWNPADDENPAHADYVLLLTKIDLEFKGNHANSGLGRMGLCGQGGGCSINEDAGLAAGLTVAHETGHVLGMNHDGEGNSCENKINIMSTIASTGPTAYKWSSCSAKYVEDLISNSAKSSCLNDAPAGSAIKSYESGVLPGSLYDADQQCKLMVGPEAEACPGVHAKNEDVCGGLVCRPKPDSGVHGCIIYATPRMDGTDCSDDVNAAQRAWCMAAKCVPMGPGSPAPRHGGWSDWEPEYHECSRTCGGGVRIKRRFCTNPAPMYGGNSCQGPDVTGQLCNVQPCSTSQVEFQAEQCAATDPEPMQGKKYHWVPNEGAVGDDSCKLDCHAEGTNWIAKRGLNVDGTQCNTREPAAFSRCVGGKCKVLGCDGHMDSGRQFDQCGVCNGKGNTCKKMTGNYNGGKAHEFTTFVTIPAGSTGVTVSQGNIYCYLSAKVRGQHLFTSGTPRVSGVYTRGRVTMKYQAKPERLEIVGPTEDPVEMQVYRTYGNSYVGVAPEVHYEYHVPTSTHVEEYMWKTKAGRCTKTCGTGTQVPTITCEGPSGSVEDYNCNINNKPAEIAQECNTHACPPRWRSSEWSQCSKSCDGGQRHRKVECVQENRNVETVLSEHMCHGQSKPSTSGACGTERCPGVWKTGEWSSCSTSCSRGVRTRSVKCYSSQTSTTPIDDARCIAGDKPTARDYCLVKPCRMDISGDSCTDKESNCFQSYGQDICTNQYKDWAHDNCKKSCGVCVENPSDYDPNCKDEVDKCSSYTPGFCTDASYLAWAKQKCKKHCGYCETTITTPAPNPNCQDGIPNCASYGSSVCSKPEYAGWVKGNCRRFCQVCELEETKPVISDADCVDTAACEALGDRACSVQTFARQHCPRYCGLCRECDDLKDNCAAYGKSMCGQSAYHAWALKNCRGFCGLCDATRKKRSAEGVELIEPPLMIELIPTVPSEIHVPVVDEKEASEIFDDVNDDVMNDVIASDDAIEDVGTELDLPPLIEDEEEHHFGSVPKEPVCNTVRTTSSGTVDVIGHVEPGVVCEQTIALPLGNRVLLKFTEMNIDCESGDVFMITDGVTGDEIPVCSSLLQNEWLSSGSVVALQFMAATSGHGYTLNYEAYPSNKTLPDCMQQFTATKGEFTAYRVPPHPTGHEVGTHEDATCEVYIVATPGHNVQMVFTGFNMATGEDGGEAGCGRDTAALVQDLEGGEEDEFCGELSPFMWESNGSRVRLVYKQSSVVGGFSVSYTVMDL